MVVSHGGARSMGFDHNIMDFSVSTNPLGVHQAVADMLKGSIREVIEYPDADAIRLERDLAAYSGVKHQSVVAGNGATEIIHNLCRIIPDGPVLIPAPTFGEYAAAASLCGHDINHMHMIDMGIDSQRFIEGIDGVRCVFVCNPANPAGSAIPKSVVSEMISAASDAGAIILIDECFMEMSSRNESVMEQAIHHDNVILLRSMTKSFGLAGLRAGYCITHPETAAKLRRLRIPWSVNGVAQAAGVVALQHPEHVKAGREYAQQEIAYMQNRIRHIPGIKIYHTDVNYLLIRTAADAHTVQRRLLKHNILVRDCSNFVGLDSHHIRIGVKRRREDTILADLLNHTCHR